MTTTCVSDKEIIFQIEQEPAFVITERNEFILKEERTVATVGKPETIIVDSEDLLINLTGSGGQIGEHEHELGDVAGLLEALDRKADISDILTVKASPEPPNPVKDEGIIWRSNGTGAGRPGNLMYKTMVDGVIKITTIGNVTMEEPEILEESAYGDGLLGG